MDNISVVQYVVLNMIKAAIYNFNENVYDQSIDFDAVLEELDNQTLLPLVYADIKNIPANDLIKSKWKTKGVQQISWGVRNKKEQNKIITSLEDEGIKCVVFKGHAAGIYYDNPELRYYGDIDILVNPEDYENAAKVINSNGYTLLDHDLYENPRNATFIKNDFEIELHRKIFFDEDALSNEMLYDAFQNIEYIGEMPVLPNVETGIILLHHIFRHLREGIGFRQIIDWMMYVDKVCDNQFWHEKLETVVSSAGLSQLAKTTTYMCKKYLGLSNTITWCDDDGALYCDEFLLYLFEQGNFGQKKSGNVEEKFTTLGLNKMSLKGIFAGLNKSGQNRWRLAQKCKFLAHFAWIYTIFRIIKEGVQNKTILKIFSKSSKHKRDVRKEMLHGFGAV